MPTKDKKSHPIRNIFFLGLLISVVYYFYQNRPQFLEEVEEIAVEAVPEPIHVEDPAEIPGATTSDRLEELRPQLKHQVEKLNAYTYCINRQSPRAMSSWGRYLSWVDPAKGPQADARHTYGVYTIYDLAPCQKRLREAAALPGRWPKTEAAAVTFEQALIVLHGRLEKAEKYYDQEDYKDDKMAGGQAMHNALMEAYHGYAVADAKLRESLIPHRKELMLSLETDTLQQKTPSLYHGLQLLGAATLIAEVSRQEDPGQIDTVALKEHLNTFSAALETASVWYADNKRSDSRLIYNVTGLLNQSERLQKESKKLIRMLRDYEPPKTTSRTRLITFRTSVRYRAEVIRVLGAHNSLISAFNRLSPFRAEVPYPQWPLELTLPKGMEL